MSGMRGAPAKRRTRKSATAKQRDKVARFLAYGLGNGDRCTVHADFDWGPEQLEVRSLVTTDEGTVHLQLVGGERFIVTVEGA